MIQSTTLHNGIRVITEWVAGAHSVSLGFWVRNGSRHESPALAGISHVLEHMLFKGTSKRSALDIARDIDSVGGVLNAFTAREFSCYFAKVLSDKLPFAVDLLSDIVLNSVFDSAELEKERRVIQQEIYLVDDTPDDIVHDLFNQNFWAGHPVGQPILGTAESVGKIDPVTLRRFMAERYTGDRIIICAAGKVKHEDVVNRITEAFSQVAAGAGGETCTLPLCSSGYDILHKPLEAVHFCLGVQALPQNHPRRFELFVLNSVLGASMSSRLFQRVREDRALAYSIYSYLNCHSDAGALVVYGGTSRDNLAEVLEIVTDELKQFARNPMSAGELLSARENLKGSLLLSLESSDNLMTRLAKNEIYHGRQCSIQELVQGFESVTAEGVCDLASSLFRDDRAFVQLVGRPMDDSIAKVSFV